MFKNDSNIQEVDDYLTEIASESNQKDRRAARYARANRGSLVSPDRAKIEAGVRAQAEAQKQKQQREQEQSAAGPAATPIHMITTICIPVSCRCGHSWNYRPRDRFDPSRKFTLCYKCHSAVRIPKIRGESSRWS